MNPFEQQVSDYIQSLRGSNSENAYHRLVELGADVIPFLVRGFKSESDPAVRSTLVKIVQRDSISCASAG
jgi:hypothetical protein